MKFSHYFLINMQKEKILYKCVTVKHHTKSIPTSQGHVSATLHWIRDCLNPSAGQAFMWMTEIPASAFNHYPYQQSYTDSFWVRMFETLMLQFIYCIANKLVSVKRRIVIWIFCQRFFIEEMQTSLSEKRHFSLNISLPPLKCWHHNRLSFRTDLTETSMYLSLRSPIL